MKNNRTFIIFFALLFAAALPLAGCSTKQNPSAQIPNPIVEVQDSQAFEKLGLSITPPEGATDVTYSIIADHTAQIQFSLDGASYTYRTAISDDENEDISGVYEEFEEEESGISVDGADWYAIIVVKTIKSGGYLASWHYDKHLFTLYTPDKVEAEAFNGLATKLAESAYRSVYSK